MIEINIMNVNNKESLNKNNENELQSTILSNTKKEPNSFNLENKVKLQSKYSFSESMSDILNVVFFTKASKPV